MGKDRIRFPFWRGDPIDGDYSLKSAQENNVPIVTYPEESDVLDFTSLPIGEKKCLIAFYKLNNEYLNKVVFYKIDDLWEAFYDKDGELEILEASPLLFNVCGALIYGNGNTRMEKDFISNLRINMSNEELDEEWAKFLKKNETNKNVGRKL